MKRGCLQNLLCVGSHGCLSRGFVLLACMASSFPAKHFVGNCFSSFLWCMPPGTHFFNRVKPRHFEILNVSFCIKWLLPILQKHCIEMLIGFRYIRCVLLFYVYCTSESDLRKLYRICSFGDTCLQYYTDVMQEMSIDATKLVHLKLCRSWYWISRIFEVLDANYAIFLRLFWWK